MAPLPYCACTEAVPPRTPPEQRLSCCGGLLLPLPQLLLAQRSGRSSGRPSSPPSPLLQPCCTLLRCGGRLVLLRTPLGLLPPVLHSDVQRKVCLCAPAGLLLIARQAAAARGAGIGGGVGGRGMRVGWAAGCGGRVREGHIQCIMGLKVVVSRGEAQVQHRPDFRKAQLQPRGAEGMGWVAGACTPAPSAFTPAPMAATHLTWPSVPPSATASQPQLKPPAGMAPIDSSATRSSPSLRP